MSAHGSLADAVDAMLTAAPEILERDSMVRAVKLRLDELWRGGLTEATGVGSRDVSAADDLLAEMVNAVLFVVPKLFEGDNMLRALKLLLEHQLRGELRDMMDVHNPDLIAAMIAQRFLMPDEPGPMTPLNALRIRELLDTYRDADERRSRRKGGVAASKARSESAQNEAETIRAAFAATGAQSNLSERARCAILERRHGWSRSKVRAALGYNPPPE